VHTTQYSHGCPLELVNDATTHLAVTITGNNVTGINACESTGGPKIYCWIKMQEEEENSELIMNNLSHRF